MAQFKGVKTMFFSLHSLPYIFFAKYGPIRESERDMTLALYDSAFTPEPVQQYVPACFTMVRNKL